MKTAKPHINSLPPKPPFKMGDMISYVDYASVTMSLLSDGKPQSKHGIVIEVCRSIVKVRPLNQFSEVQLINVADCQLIKAK
jgi:hypothetical protein